MAFYNLFTDLTNQLDGNTHFTPAEFAPEVPPEVRLFLGRLCMLHGVPAEYLVPDEKLLPKFGILNGQQEEVGSLRFFWIDPAWIESLLDGALSVGPEGERQLLLSKAMAGNYMAEAFQKELIERFKKQLSGSYTPEAFKAEMIKRMRDKGVPVTDDFNTIAAPPPSLTQNNWRLTGFLLRSSLIAGWRGLEIEVRGKDLVDDADTRIIQLVRMERIAPDTLLCLCEGIVTEVTIIQPPENLHFGLTGNADTLRFTKKFTGVSGVARTIDQALAVPLRTDAAGSTDKRVLRIKGGGNGLADLLSPAATSADFAMEMISQPIRNEVTIKWEQEKE